jgi:hypothetical protein
MHWPLPNSHPDPLLLLLSLFHPRYSPTVASPKIATLWCSCQL